MSSQLPFLLVSKREQAKRLEALVLAELDEEGTPNGEETREGLNHAVSGDGPCRAAFEPRSALRRFMSAQPDLTGQLSNLSERPANPARHGRIQVEHSQCPTCNLCYYRRRPASRLGGRPSQASLADCRAGRSDTFRG